MDDRVKLPPMTSDGIVATILGLATTATVVLHVLMASRPLTSLETALFGLLEFVFSIAFAWVLSRSTSRREFTQSQKQFALAAYRRICEVDAATTRLLAQINSALPDASRELSNELRILLAIGLGIRQTAKSSIADWAEIIGEEIVAMKQIAELRDEQDALLNLRAPEDSFNPEGHWEKATGKLESLERELGSITEKLPPSLRVLAASRDPLDTGYYRALRMLEAQLEEKGFIDLEGFWELDAGFERGVEELSPGSRLMVGYGDAGQRIGALLLKDESGRSVGVITNAAPSVGGYIESSGALASALRRSTFPVLLVKIDDQDEDSRRIYFRLRASRETA